MEREIALEKLKALVGRDLRPMADQYGITVWKDGKKNKGWAGHVVERYLGLPINSSRAPDFGTWELKVVPVRLLPGGVVKVKETMAITMINANEVKEKRFEDSHLYTKLRRQIVVSRTFVDVKETSAIVHAAATFDLDLPHIRTQVAQDYNLVRQTIAEKGFTSLSGKQGVFVQPRTKGAGHGSTSRAFYARPLLIAHILNISKIAAAPAIAEENSSPVIPGGDSES